MQVYNKSAGDVAFRVINNIIMGIIGILTLYPVLWLVIASVSNPLALHTHHTRLIFWPLGFSLEAYRIVLENMLLWRAYANTIFYTVTATAFSVTICMMGGYVLSRKYLPGRGALTLFMVFTMFFGGGLIPTFLLINALGLVNTRWVMIIPNAVSVFNVIMIMSFCRSLPDEMEESARVDGSNDWRTFVRVMIPLCKPVIAVMILFFAVGNWNSWIWPRIFLRERRLVPLQIVMQEILHMANPDSANVAQHAEGWHGEERGAFMDAVQYSVIVVSMIPIVALYPVIQKYFISGVMIGAIKG